MARALTSGRTPSSTGTREAARAEAAPRLGDPSPRPAPSSYSGWVMIRCAPAASLRSRRSHSVVASAAVGSRAQAIVNAGPLADRRAGLVLAAVEPGQDLDQPDRVDVPDARAGRVVADPRRVAGQGEDVADAERMRAEQLRLERHEVPVAGREVDEALEVEVVLDPERDRHRAHPDPGHRRVADVDEVRARRRAGAARPRSCGRSGCERGGSISTDTTNRPSRRARRERGSAAAPPATVGRASANGGRAAPEPTSASAVEARRARAGAPRRRRSSIASSAARIAAMCSGVVPQQPPTIRAPGVEDPGHDRAEVVGLARRRRTGPRSAGAGRRWA